MKSCILGSENICTALYISCFGGFWHLLKEPDRLKWFNEGETVESLANMKGDCYRVNQIWIIYFIFCEIGFKLGMEQLKVAYSGLKLVY